jgi:SAM-dependent methyltransferase
LPVSRKENKEVTRGHGLLESFLAKKRGEVADRLIPPSARDGRLLDIGCGTYPLFLMNVAFREKVGLDRVSRKDGIPMAGKEKIRIIDFDIENGEEFPFEAASFDAVTMLAVFEHIEPVKLVDIVKNIYRVLKPGGLFVMTTPSSWTDGLLRWMARAGLVSREEIEEHKDTYSPGKIFEILRRGNFPGGTLRCGYFEMFANLWVTATK